MNGRIKTIRRPITEWMPMVYELDGSDGIRIAGPEQVIHKIAKALVEVELEDSDLRNGATDGTGRVSFW